MRGNGMGFVARTIAVGIHRTVEDQPSHLLNHVPLDMPSCCWPLGVYICTAHVFVRPQLTRNRSTGRVSSSHGSGLVEQVR